MNEQPAPPPQPDYRAPARMVRVTIAQRNADGTTYRAFDYSRYPHEIPALLEGTERAYNMDRTTVYVDGVPAAGMGVEAPTRQRRRPRNIPAI